MNDANFLKYLTDKARGGEGIHCEDGALCPSCRREVSARDLSFDHIGKCHACKLEFVWLRTELHGRKVWSTWLEQ
jgi:hypothetical protein